VIDSGMDTFFWSGERSLEMEIYLAGERSLEKQREVNLLRSGAYE